MGFLSMIGSLAPTIGTIVGKLLTANTLEDGVISYDFSFLNPALKGANGNFTVSFGKEGDNYFLYNQATSSNDTVTISNKGHDNLQPQTITVTGFNKSLLTPFFEDLSKENISDLELTASSGGIINTAPISASNDSAFSITAGAYKVPINHVKPSKLGSYLEASLTNSKITISAGNLSISYISAISIAGEGDTLINVNNFDVTPAATSVEIPLPAKLLDGDNVSVNVVLNISSLHAALSLDNDNMAKCEPIDENTLERLKKAKKLN